MRQRFLVEVTLTVVGKRRKLGCTVARVIEDAVVAAEEEDNGRLERLLCERWQEDNVVVCKGGESTGRGRDAVVAEEGRAGKLS